MTRRTVIRAAASVAVLGALAAVFALPRSSTRAGPEPTTPKPAPRVAARLPVIDVHVHLSLESLARLRSLMTTYGFDHTVDLSGGHPLGGLSRHISQARASGGRITVFTSLGYEQAEQPGYGARMAQLVRMGRDMGAKGLKITKGLGLGLPGPNGKLVPVDDPELDTVFETAGELGMPIAIHSGDPKAFWLAIDKNNERYAELSAHPGWALYNRKVPSFDEILNQLERRIARHPKTKFISVHFGNCAEDIDRVARMLRTYPNMYVDTAARIPEIGRHPVEKLRGFFQEFQDRILYGSDLGIGPEPEPLFLGSSGAEPPTPDEEKLFFGATRRFFETDDKNFAHPTPIQGDWKINGIKLPRGVLEKVYFKNAARVIGIEMRTDAPRDVSESGARNP
jgi:predicted TIM-barrel fold metal-dependent hydrolase